MDRFKVLTILISIFVILNLFNQNYLFSDDDSENSKDSKIDNVQDEKKEPTDELIVIGKEGNELIKKPLAPSPSEEITTTVVSRDEIEAQDAGSAIEVIEYTPSIYLETKGRKYRTNIKIRGESNVNVLINGMSAGQDYRILQTIPASFIESVDVLRDSSYLMYGPPTISSQNGIPGFGGVVNFKFREPEEEMETELSAELGKYYTQNYRFNNSGTFGSLGYFIGAEYDKTDGPKNENFARRMANFMGHFRWNYKDDSFISLSLSLGEGSFELQRSNDISKFHKQIWEYDPWVTYNLNFECFNLWTDWTSTDISIYYNRIKSTFIQHDQNDLETENRENSMGINIRQSIWITSINALRIGFQYNHWDCPTGKFYYEDTAREEKDFGLFLVNEVYLFKGRLVLDGGIRWDQKHMIKGFSAQDAAMSKKGTSFNDRWESPVINYAFGALFWIEEGVHGLTARSSFSRESSSPDFTEINGEPLPKVEERRFDLGYEGKWFQNFDFRFTLFYKEINDGRTFAGSYKNMKGDFIPYYTGMDYERDGFEVETNTEICKFLTCFVNYAYLESDNKTTEDQKKDIPEHTGSAGIRFKYRGWKANLSIKFVSSYESNFFVAGNGYVDAGDYWKADVNVGYEFDIKGTSHEISLGLKNMGDVHYQTVPGWEDKGYDAFAGYTLKF